jgi:hypothetical protein
MENIMEPEDTFTVKLPRTQGYWVSNSMPGGDLGYVSASTITASKPDLSVFSTQELLNECYRRRAIEKFTTSLSVDSYMMQQHPDMIDYAMRDLSRDVWDKVMSNKKFIDDAFVVNQTRMHSVMSTDFEAEIYVCKHPTKVKR